MAFLPIEVLLVTLIIHRLLEHETFTTLLRAVFHLMEELIQRGDVTGLPDSDLEHRAGDIR